jgi:hypothetical protein
MPARRRAKRRSPGGKRANRGRNFADCKQMCLEAAEIAAKITLRGRARPSDLRRPARFRAAPALPYWPVGVRRAARWRCRLPTAKRSLALAVPIPADS